MIVDFDRYLKNTTIFEYKTNNIKWQIFHKNPNYNPIKINWISYFSNQSFFQFIDNILCDLELDTKDEINIKIKEHFNIEFENDFSEKIRFLFQYIIEKYSKRKEEYALRSVFKNLKDFFEKAVFGKEHKDINWKKILLPNYTYTDAENFYHAIWNNAIKNIFKWNKNIEKLRQTRNKFIEHNDDSNREVNFIYWWDNTVWRVSMRIFIKNENKEFQFSLCPLLDFCMFINEILISIKNTPAVIPEITK